MPTKATILRILMIAAVAALAVGATDARFFRGALDDLVAARAASGLPCLRKDFLIDPYQVDEARAFGADAVLLMANLLDRDEMLRFYDLTCGLGMDALFECHTREQMEQVPANAKIYGINSRTFAATSGTYDSARTHRASGATETSSSGARFA